MTQEHPQINTGVTARAPRDPCTARILEAYFDTYNEHGWGFLESVYRRGLVVELRYLGAAVATEVRLPVFHRGVQVGDYVADVIVDDRVIVECKAVDRLVDAHRAQLLNYLKATYYEIGLLLNFGRKPEFERLIFSNDNKRRRPAQ
jgi:GxxExxY protein